MTAIQHMVAYLTGTHKPWTPDRFDSTGPKVGSPSAAPTRRRRIVQELHPQLKGRILGALQRGPSTASDIAKLIRYDVREVNAKLSRLYRDGLIDRAKDARSPVTRRLVQVYALRVPHA